MESLFFQFKNTLKIHLLTLFFSVLLSMTILITDKDFGNIELDLGTIITLGIYFLMSQLVALIGNGFQLKLNNYLVAFCYSILGILFGISMSLIFALVC